MTGEKGTSMKQIVGYLVRKGGEVIAATGDEREAMYIARQWKGVSYKVVTTVTPKENPETVQTVVYDGTI